MQKTDTQTATQHSLVNQKSTKEYLC